MSDNASCYHTLPYIVLNMSLTFWRWSLLRLLKMSIMAFSSVPGERYETPLAVRLEVQSAECQTCSQEIMGPTTSWALLLYINLYDIIHTHVLLSPSSRSIYTAHFITWQPHRAADTSTNWWQSHFCVCTVSMEQATNGAETAAMDGLVLSWSENISVSFCLRAPGYGLTLWCTLGLLVRGTIQVPQLQLQYILILAWGRWCHVAEKLTMGLAESDGSLLLGLWLR